MTTLEQKFSALELANVIKLEHARIRRELAVLPKREARAKAAAILRNPDEAASRLRVNMLLRACRRTGDATIRPWFLKSGVVAHARLEDIPPGKREALARLVEA